MDKQSALIFFRQSSWLVIANVLCGFFMMAVHLFAVSMPDTEYGVFQTLLRIVMLLSIPAAGLQTVFAYQAASAINEHRERQLAGAIRSVLFVLVGFWLVAALLITLFSSSIVASFKIEKPAALWVTLAVALGALSLPALQGLLQGAQNFSWLGAAIILNGFGRFISIFIIVGFLKGESTGAMTGALIGVASACAACLWGGRSIFKTPPAAFEWRDWIGKAIPLGFGAGASLFIMSADMLFVQSHFPAEVTPFYAAAAMVGIALVTLTTPMAAVMFPKVVKSFNLSKRTDALLLAAGSTLALGMIAALVCSLFPKLPLYILYFRKLEFLRSSPLVPWFAWGMLPLTLGNVLVVNLLARNLYAVVPWLAAVALAYGLTLWAFVSKASSAAAFTAFANLPGSSPANPEQWARVLDAFRHVVQILGGFAFLYLMLAVVFTWRAHRMKALESPQTGFQD